MTVSVSNTNLNDSFNTWRLNTNLAATVISNNVVTVTRAGSANRGGAAKGNGHVSGTFSATNLRTSTLKGGNTTSGTGGALTIASNTTVSATSLTVSANATFTGNVNFTTAGTDRIILGDISRVRVTGGTRGQFLRVQDQTDVVDFKALTLRDISNLSSNSAHLILSGANSTFSDNGDSTHLIFGSGADRVQMYLAKDSTAGDSDLYVNLVDTAGDSRFTIADSANAVVGYIDSAGNIVATTAFLPSGDDSVDLGSSGAEFKDAYIDGVAYIDELSMATGASQGVATSLIPKTDAVGNLGSATRKWGTLFADNTNGGAGVFNTLGVSSTLTVNGAVTFNGDVTLNSDNLTLDGNTVVGDATTDTVTFTAQVDSDFDPQTGSQRDMGSTSNRWHNIYANNVLANTITTDNGVTINGDLTVVGNTTFSGDAVSAPDGSFTTLTVSGSSTLDGNIDLGNQTTDTITVTGQFDSALIPSADDTYDLGTSSKQWQDLYLDGTASIDTLTVDELATFSGHRITVSGNGFFSANIDVADTIDVTNSITNDGTVMLGKNAKLHANNTISNGTLTSAMLANTMNLGTGGVIHGSASQVPIIRVNKQGQVIGISNTSVAGVTAFAYAQANNNLKITTATGTTYDAVISAATANTTTAGTSDRGVASFNSEDFSVSSGLVSLKDATTGAVLAVSATANETTVSRTNGTVTIGLPDDVTVTGQLNVGENVVISGNLTVSGTTTTVDSETVLVADNIITLNSNWANAATENAGISVERGSDTNVQLRWNETDDKWQITEDGSTFYDILKDDATFAANSLVNTKMSVANTQTLVNSRLGSNSLITLSGDVTGSAKFSSNSAVLTVTANTGAGSALGNYMTVANTQTLVGSRLGAGASVTLTGDVTGTASFSSNAVSIATTYNNDVVLGTDTSGNYVATITCSNGISSTGATSGEGIAHTISIDTDLRGDVFQIGRDTNDYYVVNTTTHDWYLDGVLDLRLQNDGNLHVEGNVVAHSAVTSSDIKLKENIKIIEDPVAKVQQIKGVEFTWKKDGNESAGVIAQDVEQILPQAVTTVSELNSDDTYKAVNYDALIGLLVESIKELKAEIDELKANK